MTDPLDLGGPLQPIASTSTLASTPPPSHTEVALASPPVPSNAECAALTHHDLWSSHDHPLHHTRRTSSSTTTSSSSISDKGKERERDKDDKKKKKLGEAGVVVTEGIVVEAPSSSSEASSYHLSHAPRLTEIALADPESQGEVEVREGVLLGQRGGTHYLSTPTPLTTGTGLQTTNSIVSESGTTNTGGGNSLSASFASSQRPILQGRESDLTATQGSSSSGFGRPSWKSGGGRKAKDTLERRRLAALGFEEELQRDFDFWASWGIGMSNLGFLPGTLLGVLTAMGNGGGSMYAFAWPLTGIFMCCLAAVLGEMASTWPVAGAMFTWTFRICRGSKKLDGWARYLSWIVGSYLLCSHVLIQIVLAYQLAHVIQGLVSMHVSTFHTTFWKSMGIGWAILAFCGIAVSTKICRSAMLWRMCGFAIVLGFVTINIILLVHSPTIQSASYVFLQYNNNSGFSAKGYVYLIGWVQTSIDTGMEACAHMAEDTKTPARTVPLAMFWCTAVSYFLGWISICVFLATANTSSMDRTISQPGGVLSNTVPLPWATTIICIVILALVAQNVAQLLATSRFIWALARESALPFSAFFHRLSKSQGQPVPAIWMTVIIASLSLLLIGISTKIVGTILLNGAGFSNMMAYITPIVLYLLVSRDVLTGDGRAQWTLRVFSKPLAAAATAFGVLFLIVICFPTDYPVNKLSISYASVVAVAILLLSTTSWIFYGNSRYAGPIKTSTRWTLGAEVELPSSTSFKSNTAPPAAGIGGSTSAAHGRSAHVFSSFPTAQTGHETSYYPTGATTSGYTSGTGGYSSAGEGDEEERRSSSVMEEESKGTVTDYWRQKGRWLSGGSLEDGGSASGVRGRIPAPPPGVTP